MEAAANEASVPSTLPLNFGKRLAHTDKIVRDRGFKLLKKWLQSHQDLERLDYMKLWKGLYFAMWMADKRPVQQELSVNVALLLNDVPREKRNLWLETFWQTMRDAWEKLDVHRVSKYLLFLRIVIAECFKDLRVGGWQLTELKERAAILTQHAPKLTNSAPSPGITMQLTRVLWDELLPQLGESPKASQEAILTFLEPFIALAESSYVDGLARSVHENVLRKAPPNFLEPVLKRVLEGAARTGILKERREALYDTADELEKMIRQRADITSPHLKEAVISTIKAKSPSPKAKTVETQGSDINSSQAATKKLKRKASKKAEVQSQEGEVGGQALETNANKTKKKKLKRQAANKAEGNSQDSEDGRLVMSPLLLPRAALPVEKRSSSKPKKTTKKAAKKSTKKNTSAELPASLHTPEASGTRPKPKKRTNKGS
eukprot:TRINITY_DN104497_c0_g1_i1.p1 TRINITY_DN104497_c0_g1~~TRINITY_DN104497_c0_g1_i1.p1  ORF type:complete len:452 (+),score=102.48 TRINITY_DN104497_c0_g1_i1:61-1356(+)